jgi:D-alanyl-D-alanine carboxypeptidase (penicillin-binding protein 5/6)
MTALRYATRALALTLSLTAAGAFSVVGPLSASAVPAGPLTIAADGASIGVGSQPGAQPNSPVGGYQLGRPGVVRNLPPGVPAPPAMPGAAYVLADLDTGAILVARGAHAHYAPASTLKTLTALTLIPILDANARIRVQPADVAVQGTHVGVLAGTSYSVRTLLQGMLITSGNDAAFALARGNHGVGTTLRAMNAKAAGLNAFDTVAKDPSGLDKPGQSSSAYDLALIGRAGMRLPDFRTYVGTRHAVLPGGRSIDGTAKPGFKVSNHNRFLHNYRGAIGIKNGYTRSAKFTYVEAATRGGKTYLLTEMASPSSNWRPTAAMLDWAFAYGSSVTPVGTLVEPGALTGSAPIATPPPTAASPQTGASPVTTASPPAAKLAARAALQTRTTAAERSTRLAALPWVGVLGVLTLVGAWTGRTISRKRR